MSKGATKEEELGKLHSLVYKQYTYLCSDPEIEIEYEDKGKKLKKKVKMLTPKELLTALSGGAKFLNDNDIKAPRFVSDTNELEDLLAKKKKERKFGKVIDMKEASGNT